MLLGPVSMSLGALGLCWEGVGSLPTAQTFGLLAAVDALLAWNWRWLSQQAPHTGMEPEPVPLTPPSLAMRRLFLGLSACLLFALYRALDPYVRDVPWGLKLFAVFMLCVMSAGPILRETNWTSQGTFV